MRAWKNPPAPGKSKLGRWLYTHAALVICIGIPAILAIIDLLT
jgi:hypothetical protein